MRGGAVIDGQGTGERPSLQSRLESGRAGRWLISAFLVVTLCGILIANLPAGPVQRHLAKVTQSYMFVAALDQRWNMFAPYPRHDSVFLEARVVRADGTVTMWHPHADGPLLGTYRDSHWVKYAEHALPRPDSSDTWPGLWEPLARYIAAQEGHHGAPPVSVTLVKRSAENFPPDGRVPDRTPFKTQDYYTLRLP